jgi:uncharacterized protein (TIGR00290 family)
MPLYYSLYGMKVIVSWSGGKDSSFTLYKIRNDQRYEIVGLLSTFIEESKEITLHGVSIDLIRLQAHSLRLPLYEVYIPKNAPNEVYNRIMAEAMKKFLDVGVEGVVFGDIFLEDVRKYREENLNKIGVKAVFPLWGYDTRELAYEFINRGFRAVVVSIDSEVLDDNYLGRDYNRSFVESLPDNVDPAGENGEFHTYVYDGPIFMSRIYYRKSEVIREGRFHYQKLSPV